MTKDDGASSLRALCEGEDQQLWQALRHERDMNRAFERRCQGAKPNHEYACGPPPASRFYTTKDYLSHLVTRERNKFHPDRQGAPPTARSCRRR